MTEFCGNSSHKKLHILSVMNSFKESMTSSQANQAVQDGIADTGIPFVFQSAVFADGGQGTLEALQAERKTENRICLVHDALFEPKYASYTVVPSEGTVYMEMAQAAPLTDQTRTRPLQAATNGVGEMIADALDQGFRHFVIGIGGSATSDGGKGMLEALGFAFLKENGYPAKPGNIGLKDVHSVCIDHVHPALLESTFEIACDVENPLLGNNGSIVVFGPQKGIGIDLQEQAEAGMANWARCAREWHQSIYPDQDSSRLDTTPGAGAAGGLGFAFLTFLNGTLKSGADLVIEQNQIEEKVRWADIIITGEGSFDSQSLQGKGPGSMIDLARRYHKKVLVFAGAIGLTPQEMLECGADGCFSIMQAPCSLEKALEPQTAVLNLRKSVFEVFQLIDSFGGF